VCSDSMTSWVWQQIGKTWRTTIRAQKHESERAKGESVEGPTLTFQEGLLSCQKMKLYQQLCPIVEWKNPLALTVYQDISSENDLASRFNPYFSCFLVVNIKFVSIKTLRKRQSMTLRGYTYLSFIVIMYWFFALLLLIRNVELKFF